MRNLLLFCLLIAAQYISNAKGRQKTDMAVYAGKYQMTVRGQTGYIQIEVKNTDLILTALWTGEVNTLKHLSGDNFMMVGKDWSVKFTRDAKGNITSVLVMGHDLWTKVK